MDHDGVEQAHNEHDVREVAGEGASFCHRARGDRRCCCSKCVLKEEEGPLGPVAGAASVIDSGKGVVEAARADEAVPSFALVERDAKAKEVPWEGWGTTARA